MMNFTRRFAALRPRRRRSPAGLTLVELLISLAITAMIGASVCGMLIAMAQGTEYRKDAVAAAVGLHLTDARLSDALRSSRQVLAQGEGYIVLWKGDATGEGKPNLSELQRIEFDADTRELLSHQWPAGTPSSQDVEYDLSANFDAVTAALRGQARFPEQVWASQVDAWTVTLDHVDPRQAKLVSYRLTLTREGTSESRATSAALRNAEAVTP